MQRRVLLFFFLVVMSIMHAQVFLINTSCNDYLRTEKKVSAGSKNCFIINFLSKTSVGFGGRQFKPFILLKVFDYRDTVTLSEPPKDILKFEEYVAGTVLPKLNAQALLPVNNFTANASSSNINQFDSLVIFDGSSYKLIPGVLIIEFFNLYDFKQSTVLQTNQTNINTKAKVVGVYKWVNDSLPIPQIKEWKDPPDNKIFLLKKVGADFTFFRWPSSCADCPLTFYNEFVFRKGFGVISFKSKFIRKNLSPGKKIAESFEYFYFK
jgi:hypothetical protein